MSFLTGLFSKLLPYALDWVWGKLTVLADYLIEYFSMKKSKTKREEMATTVKEIADEIKRLKLAGEPIPEELKEKLREKSKDLVRSNIDNIN